MVKNTKIDVFARNRHGDTAMSIATQRGNDHIIKILKEMEDKSKQNVDALL